ncbi:MAG: alanine:cation symporter family protein [Clostridiales bacterium]|nr:alanine:cation symporter family protein [Candidatus Cacconaster stercorequi]
MVNKIDGVVNAISSFLYNGPKGYFPFVIIFLICGGLYFTCRTKFIQFRMFGESIRVVSEKPQDENSVSSFGALMVSTASRVGTGNIVGVSTAICCGGVGAVFWMWLIAIVGGASAFIESTLAQIYKKRDNDGSSFGGPSYYMETALKQRWLGVVFAVIIILTYAVGYNALASYNLQSAFTGFNFYKEGTTPLVIGIILAILFAICVMGGAKRLTKVTGVLVPVMGIIYIAVSLIVIFMNISGIPAMFKAIFVNAFDFKAIFGGFSGSCLMYGIKRGLYSNEAGMGSAPNAAATADVSHPVKQGLVQMLSVFIDTLLICTATAFMCLLSGVAPTEEAAGAPFVQEALSATFGSFGPIFIAVAMCLFAFTTLIGNYYYCEGCLKYIMKRTPSKTFLTVFRLVAAVIVMLGAVVSMGLAWDTADMMQALMVVINIPVILILGKPALDALKDYTRQRKEGKNPEFKAADIGLKEKTDFWN